VWQPLRERLAGPARPPRTGPTAQARSALQPCWLQRLAPRPGGVRTFPPGTSSRGPPHSASSGTVQRSGLTGLRAHVDRHGTVGAPAAEAATHLTTALEAASCAVGESPVLSTRPEGFQYSVWKGLDNGCMLASVEGGAHGSHCNISRSIECMPSLVATWPPGHLATWRADRVVAAPVQVDRAPPAALERPVEVDEHHRVGHLGPTTWSGHEQVQEDPASPEWRPAAAIENPRGGGDVTVVIAALSAQSGRACPSPTGQQRPLHQGEGVGARRRREHDGQRLADSAQQSGCRSQRDTSAAEILQLRLHPIDRDRAGQSQGSAVRVLSGTP